MNFIEAIKLIKQNENLRIKREENAKVSYSSWSRNLYIEDRINIRFHFTPTVEEILAEDWCVVRDEKLHSFEEALKAYKRGDTIVRNIDRPEQKRNIINTIPCLFTRGDLLAHDWIIIDKED